MLFGYCFVANVQCFACVCNHYYVFIFVFGVCMPRLRQPSGPIQKVLIASRPYFPNYIKISRLTLVSKAGPGFHRKELEERSSVL